MLAWQRNIELWRVRMRPGKPLACGWLGETPLLGLPGTTVSAAVTYELFGQTSIHRMLGSAHVERRLRKVTRQVSDLARLEIEISKERNPRVSDCQVAEGTLYLKGVTLRSCDRSPDMAHSISLCADELAVQVKRHRDKRRKRRESRAAATPPAPGDVSPAA